jgi:hypothetical protein
MPAAGSCEMLHRIRIIPNEAVPKCGSYEVRFPDGRPSRFYYWDDIAGRRLRPDLVDGATARREAQALARTEQDKLRAGN